MHQQWLVVSAGCACVWYCRSSNISRGVHTGGYGQEAHSTAAAECAGTAETGTSSPMAGSLQAAYAIRPEVQGCVALCSDVVIHVVTVYIKVN